MRDKLLYIRRKHPLSVIILIALAVRIIAMIFSKGYGFEDEHFYVETTNAWLDNIDNTGYETPQGISLLYVTINYLIFGFFKLLGIHNPQWLMFFSRLIHGLTSLTIITLSYRITKIIADRKTAINVAWLLALLWFMPYVSVHNIVQVVAIPFLLYGTLLIIKQEKLRNELKNNNLHRTSFIIAGIFLGLGFSLWYYSLLYYLLIIIVLLAKKNWKGTMMSLAGFLIAIGVTQTIPDLIVWGRPLKEMRVFFANLSFDCLRVPAGYYILAVVSILMALDFLVFNSSKRLNHKRLSRYLFAFCNFINAVLLVTTMFMYSSKPEVKAMTYLSKDKDIKSFIIEDSFSISEKRPPLFYERYWSDYIIVNQEDTIDFSDVDADYIVFRENKNLEQRVDVMRSFYPDLKHEVTYKPYFAQIMYKWLNHSKKDGCVAIYKVNHEDR